MRIQNAIKCAFLKCTPAYMYPKSAFRTLVLRNRCKIRLELRDGLQGCTPSFFMSMSYEISRFQQAYF